jgi:hypothetical protein
VTWEYHPTYATGDHPYTSPVGSLHHPLDWRLDYGQRGVERHAAAKNRRPAGLGLPDANSGRRSLNFVRRFCGMSLEPRKPVLQPRMVLGVASRLDPMYFPTPRILRRLPTLKLHVAVGEAEIAASGMAVGGYIGPPCGR